MYTHKYIYIYRAGEGVSSLVLRHEQSKDRSMELNALNKPQ